MIINKEYAYEFLVQVAMEHELTSGSTKNITQRIMKERKLKKRHMVKLAALCSIYNNKSKEIKIEAKKRIKELNND